MDAREHALSASDLLATIDQGLVGPDPSIDVDLEKALELAVAHALTALALQSTGVYEVKGD